MDGTDNSMKPGMSHVATAGERLVITDNVGDTIEIETRESPDVIRVIEALDDYIAAKREGVTGPVLESLWHVVQINFDNLPVRIVRDLKSFQKLGLRI